MFYPEDASVPSRLETEAYITLAIDISGVSGLDYFYAYNNHDPQYPYDYDDTLEMKYRTEHHLKRSSFSFFILNSTNMSELLGGITIRPAALLHKPTSIDEAKSDPAPKYEAVVSFWVLQSRQIDDLDREVLGTLIRWLKREWSFSRVFFELEVSNSQERQIQLFTDAGLKFQFTDWLNHPVYGE